jgi:hypothetical protein
MGDLCLCKPGRITFLICDPCKDSLPDGLWMRFVASDAPERKTAGEEIEKILAAKK